MHTHYDILGNPIHVGSVVAVGISNSTVICSVTSLTPKLVRIQAVSKKGPEAGVQIVKCDRCVVLTGEDVLAYVLKG